MKFLTYSSLVVALLISAPEAEAHRLALTKGFSDDSKALKRVLQAIVDDKAVPADPAPIPAKASPPPPPPPPAPTTVYAPSVAPVGECDPCAAKASEKTAKKAAEKVMKKIAKKEAKKDDVKKTLKAIKKVEKTTKEIEEKKEK